DRAIRPSRKIAACSDKMFDLLGKGILFVEKTEFLTWYRLTRAKNRWPSQRSSLKVRRGRPTKQTVSIRNGVWQLVDENNWRRDDGIPELGRRLAAAECYDVPSEATLERLVVQMHRETGNDSLRKTLRARCRHK